MSLSELSTDYAGRKGRFFPLALKTGVLTVLTLGFYRFWMKTRLRRFYWSAIRPGGFPLEYTGTAYEKLMGFLTAVVIMAFYIGVVNLILMFFSYSVFQGNQIAYGLSFLGILPIIFYAQYRARRYVLARTRWRGIRFGLEPGAWGYAWRAGLWWLVTLATGGLLWPVMTFKLEKYRTDHTYFGDQRFIQGGNWRMLFGAMKHVYYAGLASGVTILIGTLANEPALFGLLTLTVPWAIWGLFYWKAESFRRLTDAKTLGEIGFRASPRVGRLIGIYAIGSLVMSGVYILLVVLAVAYIGAVIGFEALAHLGEPGAPLPRTATSSWLTVPMGIFFYFTIFILWGVMTQTFFTLPMVAHFASTAEILNPMALTRVQQRARDEFAEAEGFADALDVGAAL